MKSLPIRRERAPYKAPAPRHISEHTDGQTLSGLTTPAHPDNILQLQRMVGNQHVQRLLTNQTLQREDSDSPPGPLKPAQIVEAVSWYQSQPQKYSPTIITQIQTGLGTEPTGKMSPVDVQAVANHQQTLNESESPELTVDGKAGPRTLPTLFKQGLAQKTPIEGFVADSRTAVFEHWEELSPDDRIRGLAKEANKRLKAEGIPETDLIIGDAGGNLGQFSFATWSLDIGKPAFEEASPGPDTEAAMADTIYHESRHCEQWFRMAQLLAGQGKNAKQIMKTMGVKKQAVADAAVATPLAPGSMEALIAQGWFDSVYGSGAAHRKRVLTEAAAAQKAHEKAEAAHTKNPTPDNEKKLAKALARLEKADNAVFELPEESDAEHVAGRVTS